MFKSLAPPDYLATIDREKCIRCKRCIQNCGWNVYSWGGDKVLIDTFKCVKCLRCYHYCPEEAIEITDNPTKFKQNAYWGFNNIRNIKKQAETGGIPLTGVGSDMPYPILFDNLLIDACQVTNPSIAGPVRELLALAPLRLRLAVVPHAAHLPAAALRRTGKTRCDGPPPRSRSGATAD